MKINEKGREIIKKYEGFESKAYLCPAGVWTIGYGFTVVNGKKVKKGDTMSEEVAENELIVQLEEREIGVMNCIEVNVNINQFSALVSLAYNIGVYALSKSTLMRKLNSGDYEGASKEFGKWVYSNGRKLNGLVKRRETERQLFVEGV